MQLSKRLFAVSEMVSSGFCLADIGTDHGYIPIYLIEKERIPSAIAMDVNRGPLERARIHIREHGLEDRIQTRLSDGLEKLAPGEADTVLIAGMGGMLTIRILEEGRDALESVQELILQPQSDIREVRAFLEKSGYWIDEENMIEEDGKIYPMMRAVKNCGEGNAESDTGDGAHMTELELRYGPVLLKKENPVLQKYLERERQLLLRVRDKLLNEKGTAALKRLEEIETELVLNEEAGRRRTEWN
ncbi:MAG: class I SAM-dependent methyltransferase [Lachnospiraceae bacterium]|nr:class I SAM-dependent methyltransferase [Lachnospiraceae bacterium]